MDCRRLDDVTQARLALRFASCFLQTSGLQPISCHQTDDIRPCLRRLSDRQFDSYREFFTHTQNMCSFLQVTKVHSYCYVERVTAKYVIGALSLRHQLARCLPNWGRSSKDFRGSILHPISRKWLKFDVQGYSEALKTAMQTFILSQQTVTDN